MASRTPKSRPETLTRSAYDTAVARLEEAARQYYDGDTLTMDDGTYDELIAVVRATEEANPSWVRSGVTTAVAAGVSRGGDVEHSAPMLSLDNAYDDDELGAWYERLVKVTGRDEVSLCVEPKLDGLALAARYRQGVLEMVVTRGDGQTGEDVTARARGAVGLPARLATPIDVEVRGECVMTAEQFEAANADRVAGGKPAFANPRNAVAGSIRNQSSAVAAPMTFCAYGIHALGDDDSVVAEVEAGGHVAAMTWLENHGVNTAIAMGRAFGAGSHAGLAAAAAACTTIAANRAQLDCGIDGAVVKADDPAVRADAGATGKAPRWAVARKFPPDTKLTTLVDIECNVGRTGALTVRAVLEPVAVGGVVIRYCTLSNPSEIARKDLRIGDEVWVRRAGEVIPEITGVHVEARPSGVTPWPAPSTCPRCGSDLDRTQKVWRCPRGRACGLAESIEYAMSREALDVEGMGAKLVAQLVEAGMVADLADVFSLTAERLTGLERMGETSAAKVVAELEGAKALPLSRVLTALGVRLTGRRMCRRIAEHFGSMDALRQATVDELAAVEGIGEVRAESILAELAELAEVIERLAACGVRMDEPVAAKPAGGALAGKRVCVTGSVPGLNRDEAHALVERLGGTVMSGVTKKTDLLVQGDGGGSKAKKAAELGVAVMTAEAFLTLG
jgi:DNA ligase (NAD+)